MICDTKLSRRNWIQTKLHVNAKRDNKTKRKRCHIEIENDTRISREIDFFGIKILYGHNKEDDTWQRKIIVKWP